MFGWDGGGFFGWREQRLDAEGKYLVGDRKDLGAESKDCTSGPPYKLLFIHNVGMAVGCTVVWDLIMVNEIARVNMDK